MGLHEAEEHRRRVRHAEVEGTRLMFRTAWWLLKAFAVLWVFVMIVGLLAGPQG